VIQKYCSELLLLTEDLLAAALYFLIPQDLFKRSVTEKADEA